jgi:hypothetical protein
MSTTMVQTTVKYTGVKPLLFDRYAGNEARLEPIDKVYWGRDKTAIIPQVNIYSALAAENTKSVAKMFYGKKAKPVGMAIQNGLVINEDELQILKEGDPIHCDDFDKHFEVVRHVARINKSGTAIPNPKERPQLDIPWSLSFSITFIPNGEVNWEVMQQCFHYAGIIGLGTYRPLFGGFTVEFE